MESLEQEETAQRFGEAGVTNLLLTLQSAAHKGCGGSIVANRQDSRRDPLTPRPGHKAICHRQNVARVSNLEHINPSVSF